MPTLAAVLDALCGLLEAEETSIFRFMGEGTPYLTRATIETRRRIEAMNVVSIRHAGELGELIAELGGVLRPGAVNPDDQYLAYLSLKFLVPELAEAKRRTIERYENALRAIKGAAPRVMALLENHLEAHRADLEVLVAPAGAAAS